MGCLLAQSGAWQRAEELPRPLLKEALADALGYASVAAMEEAELRSPVTLHGRLEARARNMLTAAGATLFTMRVAEKLFQAVPHSLRRRLHVTELSEFAGELP